jgi:hypothetical protein
MENHRTHQNVLLNFYCSNQLIFSKFIVFCHIYSIIHSSSQKEILWFRIRFKIISPFKYTTMNYLSDFSLMFWQHFYFCSISYIVYTCLSLGVSNEHSFFQFIQGKTSDFSWSQVTENLFDITS